MTVHLLEPATVFTLQGAVKYDTTLRGWLNGVFDRAPYRKIRVDYPANMDFNSITEGIRNVDDHIRSTEGNIILLGQSQGAMVAAGWMDRYRDDYTAPGAARLQSVLTGNPLRHPTGKLIGDFVVGGGRGKATSIDTPWPIIDVARKGDNWAIKDTKLSFWERIWAMILDLDHSDYTRVDLFAPPLSQQQFGNTTSLVVP